MHTLGLLWEWSHTFGGSPIHADFVSTSRNTKLKALAGEAFQGPGWYGDGRIYVEALEAGDNPHLRVSVFARDPRPRMEALLADSWHRMKVLPVNNDHTAAALALAAQVGSEEPSLLLGQKSMLADSPRLQEMRKNVETVDRILATRATNYRVKMTTEHHAAVALALAINAGIPGAMHCYPTALGYEVYCTTTLGLHGGLPLHYEYALADVEKACRQIPGFLGVRKDERGYMTAVVACRHPGQER